MSVTDKPNTPFDLCFRCADSVAKEWTRADGFNDAPCACCGKVTVLWRNTSPAWDAATAAALERERMTGAELIAAERQRQIEKEGWTPEHDDANDAAELACIAALYALPKDKRKVGSYGVEVDLVKLLYPHRWDEEWWKPKQNRVRDLARAGALIAAEIDRLQRRSRR